MNEMLLHYLWKNKIFSNYLLRTTDDRELTLISTGFPHKDAGPDFKQAVIKIGQITWVGDVEIHVRTSDWVRHGHQKDEKYNSIILHVVYEDDMDLGMTFPTLELKGYVSEELLNRYEKLSQNADWLPCRSSLETVGRLKVVSMLSRVATERLERKQHEIFETLHSCHDDWQETVYRFWVRNFGFRTNGAAFEMLAKSLSYRCIAKHGDSRTQVYALLFGQAGFLEDDEGDSYYSILHNEYKFLQYKYKLSPIPLKIWNLLRLRPQNFPCIRLAQLSEFFFKIPKIAHRILTDNPEQLYSSLKNCTPHEYWTTHFHFGKETKQHSGTLGDSSINTLMINTVIPMQYAYGAFCGNDKMKERAMMNLESLEAENNQIVSRYCEAGWGIENALVSQAVLELHQHYCLGKRCLECEIGCDILQAKKN